MDRKRAIEEILQIAKTSIREMAIRKEYLPANWQYRMDAAMIGLALFGQDLEEVFTEAVQKKENNKKADSENRDNIFPIKKKEELTKDGKPILKQFKRLEMDLDENENTPKKGV